MRLSIKPLLVVVAMDLRVRIPVYSSHAVARLSHPHDAGPHPPPPTFLNSSLFCIYFTLLLPLFSFSFPLLPFSFPFLPFSFPFLPFSFTFSPFFPSPFHIFSPNDIGWYSPPQGGYFPIYRPLPIFVRANQPEGHEVKGGTGGRGGQG